MPIEVGIWRVDGEKVEPVASSALERESKLEDILEQDISILGLDVLLILGRQVITKYGKRVDLLAMDVEGTVYVIELKKDRTPREVVAQALDYGFWVRSLIAEDLGATYAQYNDGQTLAAAFRARFDQELPADLNDSHQLIIVASELDAATERIVSYAADYDLPLNVVFFQHFRDGSAEYLTRSWLIDPSEAEGRAKTQKQKRPKEIWNGQDFYYSAGEDHRRNWDDMVRYGFICAGGGRWYSNTLKQLEPGHRVFACIPKSGYVGVGVVTETVQPVGAFLVQVDGRDMPILEAPLKADRMDESAEDPDTREYVVRVAWTKVLPREAAIWEKGMFANQNSVARMRSTFTLERLIERFGLTDDDGDGLARGDGRGDGRSD